MPSCQKCAPYVYLPSAKLKIKRLPPKAQLTEVVENKDCIRNVAKMHLQTLAVCMYVLCGHAYFSAWVLVTTGRQREGAAHSPLQLHAQLVLFSSLTLQMANIEDAAADSGQVSTNFNFFTFLNFYCFSWCFTLMRRRTIYYI